MTLVPGTENQVLSVSGGSDKRGENVRLNDERGVNGGGNRKRQVSDVNI